MICADTLEEISMLQEWKTCRFTELVNAACMLGILKYRVPSLKTLSDASVNSAQDKDEISKICCMPVRVSKCGGGWIYVMHIYICACVCVYAFFHWYEQEKTKIWKVHTILLIKLLFNHQQNIKEWNVFTSKMSRQHLFIYLAYNEYMQVLTNIHEKQ